MSERRRWRKVVAFLPLLLALATAAHCGEVKPAPAVPASIASAPSAAVTSSMPGLDGGASDSEVPDAVDATSSVSEDAGAVVSVTDAGPSGDCPEGMALVDTSYCPRIERTCVDEEYSPQNKITICHKFAKKQRCLVPEEHRRFCIDRYEYPNRQGAHPPWMVSWFDAQATCGSQGKRLCWESEWIAACEGPEHTPFPYGYARDNNACNIDNTWIDPHLGELYSKDPATALRELSRLDQSVRSGAKEGCVSGFGVHDLTGNFDEWVTSERRRNDKSEWAGLKGGAWGHVRNACRPVTTSHPPDFTYYFISFRCCKDAPGGPSVTPAADLQAPVVTSEDRAPIPEPVNAPGPSATKAARDWGKKKPKP